jgi:hypothetical protein
MKQRTTNRPTPTPGFAIRITDETNLGIALLIAEDDDGAYEPVGSVSSISEAKENASRDFTLRQAKLQNGGEPLCPAAYKVWAAGLHGYLVAAEFDPTNL